MLDNYIYIQGCPTESTDIDRQPTNQEVIDMITT